MLTGIQLIITLMLILIAAQLFSNALEYFGQEIGLSSGVVGSIFASVATAMPETIVPLLAIIAGTSNSLINEQISVGAIIGAPLMLSTLSTFIMAISVIGRRSIRGRIVPEKIGFVRDLNFFLIAFVLAALMMYFPFKSFYVRLGISFVLMSLYVTYAVFTIKASKQLVESGHGVIPSEELIFTKFGCKNNRMTIFSQLLVGLILLLLAAKSFIHEIEHAAQSFNSSALVLSILIIPLTTELPEKINSVIWVRKNKDTLGFGNITGAMVFQSTLLFAFGILLTPWQPIKPMFIGMLITLLAAFWLRFNASYSGLRISSLFVNGLLYFSFLFFVFVM